MKMILNIFSLILLSTSLFSQTAEEKSMIVEINKLRSNPSSYIKVIEDFKKMKTSTTIGGFTVTRKSNTDWVKECDETINFLKTAINEIRKHRGQENLDAVSFLKMMKEK